jgi:protein subunit release factor A
MKNRKQRFLLPEGKKYKREEKRTTIMLDRLQIVKQRFDEISDLIIQPDVISDQKRYVQLNQEYKTLKALAEKTR